MVRFIIVIPIERNQKYEKFTFQYGQIYYTYINIVEDILKKFTFQYGQIYYKLKTK